MPEGPEVRQITDVLTKADNSEFLSWMIVEGNHRYHKEGFPGSNLLKDAFLFKKANCKGKLIWIEIEQDQELVLINTLGMSGTWSWNRDAPYARIVFEHQRKGWLSFCDQRMFGSIKVVPKEDAQPYIDRIGHDLLQAPMPIDAWSRVRETKLRNWEIGAALMEQSQFSGIGNIYKAEILFRLGIHPQRRVKDLPEEVWAAVNQTAHEILVESYELGGSSVQNYYADGKEGQFQRKLHIYRREACPLGHPVDSVTQKTRTTWYCSICQA